LLHKCLFFISVLFIGIVASAQNLTIIGNVVDSVSKQSLSASSISIKYANGTIKQLAITDNEGNFIVQLSNKNKVNGILISHVQYNSKEIFFDKKEANIQLGSILLSVKVSSLAEVIVQGKKALVSFKIDRQIYKASQYANAANGTATDIIKNLPSVSVNGQGEITFRGSNSFLVLVNGKPTQGDPAFVLAQLPASSIENIEVITSPGADFDADGKSGIINITTKTGIQDGWMLQVNGMSGTPPLNDYDNRRIPQRYAADITAGYRKNKWDISAGLNYLRNDIAGNREGDVFTIINNTKTNFPSIGDRSFKRYNYGGRITINYQADKNNSIRIGFYQGKKYQSRMADLQYSNTRTNLLTNSKTSFTYYNENDQQKEGNFTLANIDYNHQFSAKQKIVFSALYERANLTGVTYNNDIKAINSFDTLQYTINPNSNPLDAIRVKVDYTKTLKSATIQAGYQYRYDVQDGNFLYQTKALGTNQFVINPQFTSNVKATNNIHAAYVQYAGIYKQLNYSGGLRLEQLDRNLNFSTNNSKNTLKLTNLFPSFQLRYKTWEKGVLKAGYNRRIKRTNNYELNPFPEREHSETLEQGDANLLPELIGNYELGLEQALQKGNFFITLYYQIVTNPIQRVNKVFNDTILNRVFTNAGKATQIGVESNFTYQTTKWWASIIGGNIYRYRISGKIFNGIIPIENSSWVYSINSTQSFTLPKNLVMQLSINYLSERATAQGEDSRFLTPNFSIKKITTDKRWSFQLQWLNIDAGAKQANRQRITNRGVDFFTTTNYIYETDQLQFSVGFNISKKNRKISLPQSEIGENEF